MHKIRYRSILLIRVVHMKKKRFSPQHSIDASDPNPQTKKSLKAAVYLWLINSEELLFLFWLLSSFRYFLCTRDTGDCSERTLPALDFGKWLPSICLACSLFIYKHRTCQMGLVGFYNLIRVHRQYIARGGLDTCPVALSIVLVAATNSLPLFRYFTDLKS